MDRLLNSRDEKQTIYEIYRACRLCGAGAGYKMPIIQNVVDLDGDGIELRQKIKDCVQIEVSHTDRMPPLICELCVDKVNEYYAFFDMCKQNNRRTRLRLGLPMQNTARDSAESENCILGVTEPVFVDSEAERLNRQRTKKKVKKESTDVKIKSEHPGPSPKPESRPRVVESKESSDEAQWTVTSRSRAPLGVQSPIGPPPGPRRATRQGGEPFVPQPEDLLLVEGRLKRQREKETKDSPPQPKRAKISEPMKIPVGPKSSKNIQKEPIKSVPKPSPARPAFKKDIPTPSKPPPPKSTPSKSTPSKSTPAKSLPTKSLPAKSLPPKPLPAKPLPPKPSPAKPSPSKSAIKAFFCQICKVQLKSSHAYAQHNMKHVPIYTSPKYACNACELWFPTVEEAGNHHKHHRMQNVPYKCTRCYGYFKLQQAYEDHFAEGLCLSEYEVPDVKCPDCWRTFPTNKLLEDHTCGGEDARPGGKCSKCKRNYTLLKNLLKHESGCTHKRKGLVRIEPDVQKRLIDMRVRTARCDPLLRGEGGEGPVSCSTVPQNFGLDSKCHYPYLTRVKSERFPHMVSIDDNVKQEYNTSYNDSKVQSLSALCLQAVTKHDLKVEPFESFDDIDMGVKIASIIDNLNDDTQSCNSDSILRNNKKVDGSDNIDRSDDIDRSDKNVDGNDNIDDEDGDSVNKIRISSPYTVQSSVSEDNCIGNIDKTSEDIHNSEEKIDDREISPNVMNNVSQEDNTDIDNKTEFQDKNKSKTENNRSADDILLKNNENSIATVVDVSETLNKCEGISEELKLDSVSVTKEASHSLENEDAKEIEDNGLLADNGPNDDDASVDETNADLNHDGDNQQNINNENCSKELDGLNSIDNDVSLTNEKKSKNDSVDSNECFKISNENSHSDESVSKIDIDKQKVANLEKQTENNENFSKIDEITNKILNDNQDSIVDDQIQSASDLSPRKSDLNSETNSLNSDRENGVENQDKFNVNDLSEDDRQLMADLDAQIGESDQKGVDDQKIGDSDHKIGNSDQTDGYDQKVVSDQKVNDNCNKSRNHYIEELLKKQDTDLRSLDLDSISDEEFNFDV